MSQSWNRPNVNNPILQDVAAQKAMYDALAKMDVQSFIDLPPDSKRMAINDSTGEASFEVLKNNSWVKIASINISAKQVGGFTPSQLVQNNAVVVRDAQGKIAGDILGNAASASSAATLADVLDVALGGTGGNTIEAARENLDVPSKGDLEITQTDIQDAKSRGQIGNNTGKLYSAADPRILTDPLYLQPGTYWTFFSKDVDSTIPFAASDYGIIEVLRVDNAWAFQTITREDTGEKWVRKVHISSGQPSSWAQSTFSVIAAAHGGSLNSMITTGSYYVSNVVDAPTGMDNDGLLVVSRISETNAHAYQCYIGQQDTISVPLKIAYRTLFNGNWSPWSVVDTESLAYAINHGQIGDNNLSGVPNADVNLLVESGTYAVGNSNLNKPSDYMGGVIFSRSRVSGYMMQYYIDYTGRFATRQATVTNGVATGDWITSSGTVTPNYSAGISLDNLESYTAPSDGVVIGNSPARLEVNEDAVYDSSLNKPKTYLPMKKGFVLTSESALIGLKFYPYA